MLPHNKLNTCEIWLYITTDHKMNAIMWSGCLLVGTCGATGETHNSQIFRFRRLKQYKNKETS